MVSTWVKGLSAVIPSAPLLVDWVLAPICSYCDKIGKGPDLTNP